MTTIGGAPQDAGFDYYLVKPAPIENVLAILAEISPGDRSTS